MGRRLPRDMDTYPVIKFNQYGDPEDRDLLMMFAAPARALGAWAGVPRKGWKIRMLYQRGLQEQRVRDLKKFWERAARYDPDISGYSRGPNAITITMDGMPELVDGRISLSAAPSMPEQSDLENLSYLSPRLLAKLLPRLEAEQVDAVSSYEPGDEVPDTGDNHVFGFAYLLRSMAADPERFVAAERMSPDDVGELVKAMAAIERPALVVDGQHRLVGAERAGPEICLPVVLVPNCSWAEQILQFIVINRTAKNVTVDLLADIVGFSLTPRERTNFGMRLEKAGVRDPDTWAAVTLVSQDDHSPFRGMIDFSLKSPPGAPKPFVKVRTVEQMIDGGQDTPGWRTDEGFLSAYISQTFTEDLAWSGLTEGNWRQFWYVFWGEVKDYYNGLAHMENTLPIWDASRQTNLTKGVTLRMVQTLFIEKMIDRADVFRRGKDVLLATLPDELKEPTLEKAQLLVVVPPLPELFRSVVREQFLEPGIPLRFFTAAWHTSLDTKDGQKALKEELDRAWTASRAGKMWTPPKRGKVFQ